MSLSLRFKKLWTTATPREAISVSLNIYCALLAMVLSMICGRMMYQTVLSWFKNTGTARLSRSACMQLYVLPIEASAQTDTEK